MKNSSGFYPRVRVDTTGSGAVGQAGGVLLTDTIAATGLGRELSAVLALWRRPGAVHDPAKAVLDLAIMLALGGDCLADVALLRAEPGVYGPVASDPTVSRTISALAGEHAPDHATDSTAPLIVDVDATLLTAHSDKERAKPTFKRGYGFHPLVAFVGHGPAGTGEPVAVLLRPGNEGSNTAADHITVVKDALRQPPGHRPSTRPGRRVLIRTDGAGATHGFLDWLTSQRLSYSVGLTLPDTTPDLLRRIPDRVWTEAYDAHDAIRDGAWVAE